MAVTDEDIEDMLDFFGHPPNIGEIMLWMEAKASADIDKED